MIFLYCENPLDRKDVDQEYSREFYTAKNQGNNVFLFDFEMLTQKHDAIHAVRNIPYSDSPVEMIYRGWMLTPMIYQLLFDSLEKKNYRLINTPKEYQNCHYLPDSLEFIENDTPKTVWMKLTDGHVDFEKVFSLLETFDSAPVILKDFVKSQKHNWHTACFIPDASDKERVRSVVNEFLDWQGDDLNEGLVFREYVPLEDLAIHSKSGMPLKREYRLFYHKRQLVLCCDYWEEAVYGNETSVPLEQFHKIAKNVESCFFSMDVARTKSGNWTIIELGDGQVAGLPSDSSCEDFYRKLKKNDQNTADSCRHS